jgi:hypothetical protein
LIFLRRCFAEQIADYFALFYWLLSGGAEFHSIPDLPAYFYNVGKFKAAGLQDAVGELCQAFRAPARTGRELSFALPAFME